MPGDLHYVAFLDTLKSYKIFIYHNKSVSYGAMLIEQV